jgi:hypothetical protein
MRRFVGLFLGVSGAAVGLAAGLNYLVDPYLIHQWDNAQVGRLRPAREKMSAWGKTYAVARYRPQVLYLGNSRTELGLSPAYPALAGRRVFNAALSGASLSDAAAMARHALAAGAVDTVVWGVDAPSFSTVLGTRDFDRALVAGAAPYRVQRALLDLQRGLSWDMTGDSLRQLAGRFGAVCRSSLAFRGQRDDDCIRDHMHGWGGTAKAVLPRIREFVRGEGPTPAALAEFDATLDALCARRVHVRLYINPTHAAMHQALYAAGKWPALERWMEALASAVELRRRRGCDAHLFDFSGFNFVTMEPLPQASGAPAMRYYWEPSHYRAAVGKLILDRVLGGAPARADGFGAELTRASVAQAWQQLDTGRRGYAATHPVEAALAAEGVRTAYPAAP